MGKHTTGTRHAIFRIFRPIILALVQVPDGAVGNTSAAAPTSTGRKTRMLTRAFIVPAERLGAVIAWMEARCSPDQASTIDVQSRVIAIECVSAMAADQIATKVIDRPGWRRNEDVWLFLEVLEPFLDIEAEFHFAQDIVSDCGLFDECEVAECRVLEVGFPSEAERADPRAPGFPGSGLVDQSQKITVAARAVGEMKAVGQRL